MRVFLFTLTVSLLPLTACNFRSSTSEAEVSPIVPTPIPDAPPNVAADEGIEQVQPASRSATSEPEFTLDPAPAPPTESSSLSPEESAPKPASAEEVFNSIARVLRGTVEGSVDEAGEGSQGSVFGSIGRALSQGFHEAAADESPTGN